jgi:VanZ family protein
VAVLVVLSIVFQSTQARGTPGVLSLTTNEAYVGHFFTYAAMALCALATFRRPTFVSFVAVLFVAAGLKVVMEVYQAGVPSRAADPADALANVAGASFGLLAYVTTSAGLRLLERPNPTQP